MATSAPFQHLKPGMRCAVRAAFIDYDGTLHEPGETWIFRGHSFLPYEDGLSLFVERADGTEQQIRMQWRPDKQGSIIDKLDQFIGPAED